MIIGYYIASGNSQLRLNPVECYHKYENERNVCVRHAENEISKVSQSSYGFWRKYWSLVFFDPMKIHTKNLLKIESLIEINLIMITTEALFKTRKISSVDQYGKEKLVNPFLKGCLSNKIHTIFIR